MPGPLPLSRIFPTMPPAAPGPLQPIVCSRAMGAHGCRSGQIIDTRSAAHDRLARYRATGRKKRRGGRGGGNTVEATRSLYDLAQSLWLEHNPRLLLVIRVRPRYDFAPSRSRG